MRFKAVLKVRGSIKKAKEYDFKKAGITNVVLKEAVKYSYDNPLFVKGEKLCDFKLYCKDNKIYVYMLHSYDKFEEIID